jgi:hemerythrin superfamily protein
MSDADHDRHIAGTLPEDDIVAVVLRQHARLRDLMARVQNSEGSRRQLAFDELKALLTVHETAEEKIVRPVTQATAGNDVADARNQEEQKADQALGELAALDVDSDEFATRFADFMKAVSDHAEAEENQEFPSIFAGTSQEQRIEMGHAFLQGTGEG